jgi:hypothetical protein
VKETLADIKGWIEMRKLELGSHIRDVLLDAARGTLNLEAVEDGTPNDVESGKEAATDMVIKRNWKTRVGSGSRNGRKAPVTDRRAGNGPRRKASRTKKATREQAHAEAMDELGV